MAFPKNEANSKKVRALLDHVVGLNRGDILPHEDIERVTGVYRYSSKWGWLISKFKHELERERGIAIIAEHGVGYKLCTKEEQLHLFPRKKQKESIRRLNDGMRAVEVLDMGEMSLSDKQFRALVLQNMVEDTSRIRKHVRQQDGFLRKSETSPQVA